MKREPKFRFEKTGHAAYEVYRKGDGAHVGTVGRVREYGVDVWGMVTAGGRKVGYTVRKRETAAFLLEQEWAEAPEREVK